MVKASCDDNSLTMC